MQASKAVKWVEGYLYSAHGHRALEQSVLAEGGRRGFSERKLVRASAALGVIKHADCWELPVSQVEAIDAREILSLGHRPDQTPAPVMPALNGAGVGSRLRRHPA